MLPQEELYLPPMNINVMDHRAFGRKPQVGVHVLSALEKFSANPYHDPVRTSAICKSFFI